MGARTPTKFKLRRPTYKCDECDKKFLSAQALKSHQYCLHKIKMKPKTKGKLLNLLGKPVKKTSGVQKKDVDVVPEVSDVRKIQYECPQCQLRFSVYFSAFRHIQRSHSAEVKEAAKAQGRPNATDAIKPVRVETCIKCNMRVRSTDQHCCPNVSASMISVMGTPCVCMGCQQTFPSVLMFDVHVPGLHSGGVETLFFPNIHTFTLWKDQMESQTQVKYLVLGKCNYRQTYRCTYSSAPPEQESSVAYFCPSSIIVKEYSKSIQVHFFKEHHGHSCKYKLPDRFRKYLSTEMLKKPIGSSKEVAEGEEDLYEKFKSVIDSIMMTAFNSDTETLKLLYGKAVEMEKILRTDEELKPHVKNMTDEQITNTLENLSDNKISANAPLDVKQSNTTQETISKVNTIEDSTDKKPKTVKTNEGFNRVNTNSPMTCFNDSYKEFVDKIVEKKEAENQCPPKLLAKEQKPIKTYNKKKIVKTKIGQFKPSLSPKKERVQSENDEENDVDEAFFKSNRSIELLKTKVEMDYEVIEQENDYNILILKI